MDYNFLIYLIDSDVNNIERIDEYILLKYPNLMERAILKGYIINPSSPNCIKKDKYIILLLEQCGFSEKNTHLLYAVSCLEDLALLNNCKLIKYINYVKKEQLTPKVLDFLLSKYLSINLIKMPLLNTIINNEYLFKVLLQNVKYVYEWSIIIKAFYPRDILNGIKEKNLDELLIYINKDYKQNLGNLSLIKYKLQYLYSKNIELFNKFDFNILTKDCSFLGLDTLNQMIVNEKIQQKIKILKDDNINSLKILEIILDVQKDMTTSRDDLIFLLLCHGLGNDSYNTLFQNIDYLFQISDRKRKEVINNLTSVLINVPNNEYGIKTFEELEDENLLNIRKKYFKNHGLGIYDYFLKKYNLSRERAKFIFNRYACQPELLVQLPKNLKDILLEIYNIFDEYSYEDIYELYDNLSLNLIDINTSVFLEGIIRNEYIKAFNQTLYKVKEEDRLHNFDELGVEVYEITGEFSALIHSMHTYYSDSVDYNNVYDDWNRPYIENHGICSCYITNQNTNIANDRKILIGISYLEDNSILLMSPEDMASHNNTFASTYEATGKFYFPNDLINHMGIEHGEVVIERKNLLKSIEYKRQPGYMVYTTNLDKELEPSDFNNSLWKLTVESAKLFKVPIVIINKTKISIYEEKILNDMLIDIFNNKKYNLIEDFIVRFINNIHSVIRGHFLFNIDTLDILMKEFISLVEQEINNDDYAEAEMISKVLVKTLKKEINKSRCIRRSLHNLLEVYYEKFGQLESNLYNKNKEKIKTKTY